MLRSGALRAFLDDAHGRRNESAGVGKRRGDNQSVAGFGEIAELRHVLLGHAELNSFKTSRRLYGGCYAADAFGRRGGDRENGLRLALGFVDALLPDRFG